MGTSKWLNITKEELVNLLHEKAKELGKTPTGKAMKNPTCEVYYDRFQTHSWNEILTIAGLKLNHQQGYTEEFLLEKLNEFCIFLGRNVKKEDFKKHNWIPSERCYHDKFGGILKALKMIDRLDKILDEDTRFDKTIEELRELASKLNRVPTVNEYDKNKKYGFDRRSLERRTGLSYNETCKKYLPKFKLNLEVIPISKEDCKKDLNDLVVKLGRIPSRGEINGVNNKYTITRYYTAFNTMCYYDILVELGHQPNFKKVEVKSDDQLLEEFYILFKNLGRIPYCYEINKADNTSTYNTYIERFGNLQNVCNLLNIDYFIHYRKSGAGIVCKDKNGDACKSIPEMDITNFFINNNLLIDKENYYNELINTTSKTRFDWKVKINNKEYYVEYLGMYNKIPRGSIDKRYIKKAKNKIKKVYKEGKINNCIFIFKDDYDNKKILDKFNDQFKKSFISIEYSNRNDFSKYNQISNIELLDEVMKYSNNEMILPSTTILVEKNNGLYTEIKHRFGSYEDFGIANNKICNQRYNDEKKIEQLFMRLSSNYSILGSYTNIKKIASNDPMLRGIHTVSKELGIVKFKILYFLFCLKNNIPINVIDLQWLEDVNGNGYLENTTEEDLEKIKYILENVKNKNEFIKYKLSAQEKRESIFKDNICKLFLYMKKEYRKILTIEEYTQRRKFDDNLKFISLNNYLVKHNKIMIDAKLLFYYEMITNKEYIFDSLDLQYLDGVVNLNKMKVGKKVNENHKQIAIEILKKINKVA